MSKVVGQQNSERNEKLALMRFDGQIGEKEFPVFLQVHAREIIWVIKISRSIKGSRHIFDKVLHSNHCDQYLKYSVCEKADELLDKFCMAHPQKRKGSISYCLTHCS